MFVYGSNVNYDTFREVLKLQSSINLLNLNNGWKRYANKQANNRLAESSIHKCNVENEILSRTLIFKYFLTFHWFHINPKRFFQHRVPTHFMTICKLNIEFSIWLYIVASTSVDLEERFYCLFIAVKARENWMSINYDLTRTLNIFFQRFSC